MTDDETRQTGWAGRWWPAVVLGAVVAAIYWPVVDDGLIATWDDALYVFDRAVVGEWWAASWRERLLTPRLGYPVPIPTAVYAAIRGVVGESPGPALHRVNLAVHALNVALAYRLVRRWTDRRLAGWLAVVGWAAHPLLVEAVAFVTNLKTLGFAAGFLGALLAWSRFLESDRHRWAGVAFAAGVVALGCRPEGVLVAPALLGCAHAAGRLPEWCDLERLWPVAALGAAALTYLPVAFSAHREAVRAFSSGGPYQLEWPAYLVRIGAAFALQAKHVVWPLDLHPGYFPGAAEKVRLAWIGWPLIATAAVVSVLVARRHRRAGFGLFLFWLTYLPASGLEVLPRLTADTYMYLPLLGLSLAAAIGLAALVERGPRLARPVAVGLGLAAVLGLGAVAHVQTWRWQNPLTLWEPVVRAYPEARKPNIQLAYYFDNRGEYETAIPFYERAAATMPEGRRPLDLAEAYARVGRPDKAAAYALDRLVAGDDPGRRTGAFLVQTHAFHDLDPPDDPDRRRLLRSAADASLERLADRADPETLVRIGAYFARRSFRQTGRAYLREAIDRQPALCEEPDQYAEAAADEQLLAELCRGR